MLTNENKTSTLWKNHKGWGSTHPERETFEELYRSYNTLSANSVLTYGNLLPRKSTDKYFSDIAQLDSTNDILYHRESSFKTVPLVKKYTELLLTKISQNCDHAYAILDEDGNQIQNIIPYDFSDEGLYNIKLSTQAGQEIAWGSCDWLVDTNASLLTFSNGVPEGISAEQPPVLTFYQYVGPVGERHYIDATLFDIEKVLFDKFSPVKEFTGKAASFLDSIDTGFFNKYKFNGTDTQQGIGLQYSILSNAVDSNTKDPVKGYDDNSNAQVVSLLSHKVGESSIDVCFVSEGIADGMQQIVVDEVDDRGYSKVNLEDGFVVVKAAPGTYTVKVSTVDELYAVLLVKDNETLDYELFYPREDLELTVKLPVFVDLMNLPPHLKFTTLNSYSDHITPQYYGPRTVDFVIAADETTISSRSADFVVYNKDKFYLKDAFEAAKDCTHIYLRNGVYENYVEEWQIATDLTITGETAQSVIISGAKIKLSGKCFLENVTFKSCSISADSTVTFKNCNFDADTTVTVEEDSTLTLFENCAISILEILGTSQILNSRIVTLLNNGTISLFNTAVVGTCCNKKNFDAYASYIKTFENTEGLFKLNSCRVEKLDAVVASEKSIVDSTNIDFVENLPESIKIDSSYVTEYSENIDRKRYPDASTVAFYTAFNRRVYAKLPAPFTYSEETNELSLALDTIYHTIFINENGELQCRFFTSAEITIANPDAIKTQSEEVYGLHEDTVLETERPQTLEDAILDLYWSKAGLVNGKIPIDFLPDSVAYGGLEFVGMWQFEDHEGKYPTFDDIDNSLISDDAYDKMQNGWFFIVAASNKEDDPVYPQIAALQEGEEEPSIFTAGDWVIYSNGKYQKLDRAYLDPVYSRLPEYATKTGDDNPAWSIDDGGTGLLRLSFKSLAEAIRLINEALLKLSPDRPTELQTLIVAIDEEKSTAKKVKYIEVANGLQLNQLTATEPLECWDGTEEGTAVSIKQKGVHDELPLEHVFYCGTESEIEVLDGNMDITENCRIDRFDPYKQYRLGFRAPTVMDAAEVVGHVDLGLGSYKREHEVYIAQYHVKKTAQVTEDAALFEGRSQSLKFLERRFYKFDSFRIKHCEKDTVNLRVLNSLYAANRLGGIGFLPTGTQVTGTFVVEDFTKFGTISPDAEVQVKAQYGDLECDIEITTQYLILDDPATESYKLVVEFVTALPAVAYKNDTLQVKALVRNFGVESTWTNVLALNDIIVCDISKVPSIVESAGSLLYPKRGESDPKTQFGSEYVAKTYSQISSYPELLYEDNGYGWPVKDQYVNYIDIFGEAVYVATNKAGVELDDQRYRFVTFKVSLDEIKDLCGIGIDLDWHNVDGIKIDPITGLYQNILLQVCIDPSINLMNANKAVPVFYETQFTEDEACCYAGKSTKYFRRVTFGRKPVPVKDIYIRVGIEKDSGVRLKNLNVITDL